jgi:hypothetical protein
MYVILKMNPNMLQYFFNEIEKQKAQECNYIRNQMYTLIADTIEHVKKQDVMTFSNIDQTKLHFLKHASFETCSGHDEFQKSLKNLGIKQINTYPMVSIPSGRIEFDVLRRELTLFQKINKN